ncbi:hypothetical protein [Lactococcus allomyrinae]|uniref:Uncharacterized protein n=1 Tax=Lactococcus allomyrinae TaxID=2419773 RepID=A0A387BM15_9LACT|nr:hypothetical protein [Lactococcus allomyrinae]AYG02037.1 hypothetical protein D7I46_12935 [Lactococcus allomyrinae]
MKKRTKIGIVIGLILLLLGSAFAFWFSTLPKAQEVAPPKKFITSQSSAEQKIEVSPDILKKSNEFVATFFLFDKDKVKTFNSIQGVSTDTENYFEQYGHGTAIIYKIKQATQDESYNIFITYEVTGTYQGKQRMFSIVINVGQTYGTALNIQSYTVVANE